MASSESQGLTIALIILLILTILLAVTTFLFFTSYQEATTQSAKNLADASQASSEMREMQDEINRMKELIGVGTEAELEEIETTFEDDMKAYAATVPADKRQYRQSLEVLATALTQANDQLVAAQGQITQLQQSNAAFEAAKNMELAQFQAAAQQAQQELATEKAAFNDALAAKNQENQTLLTQFEESTRKLNEQVAALQKQVTEAQTATTQLEQANVAQGQTIRQLSGDAPQTYDGEIRWVNQSSKLVWINRGRADGLQPATSFSVQNTSLPPGSGTPKGRIEVTKLLGDHMAEARIVDDLFADPLLPGDGIYSPLWEPGQRLRFAIAGRIYLDGDQVDDVERLQDLISVAGGTVDAVLQSDGKLQGDITVDTRYLVLGPAPESIRAAYDELINKAQRMGVQTITLQNFLDQMGWKGDTGSLVRYGREGNAGQTTTQAGEGFSQRSDPAVRLNEQFQRRRPPATLPAPSAQQPAAAGAGS